jgi:hypothetical protein
MLLVASETGHVYTFATKKLQPMITSEAGKALIQTCLNSPDDPDWEGVRLSFSSFETGNERERKKVCFFTFGRTLEIGAYPCSNPAHCCLVPGYRTTMF